MEDIKKQTQEIADGELNEVNGGLIFAPTVKTMQYVPGRDDPTVMTLPTTGAPIAVQPTPYTGGITFSDTKKSGIESL